MNECEHTMTQGRKGERGSWCMDCGVKVYDVDERQCQDCAHSRKLWDGTICNKHRMRVTPDMNVTFKIADGSCWAARLAPTDSTTDRFPTIDGSRTTYVPPVPGLTGLD